MKNEVNTTVYDDNNVYARNLQGIEIHITEAESGAKGYFCLGCDRELQAVKSNLKNRISYFRHAPSDIKIERKCTYSDETHRHKLAKRILLQNKYIKVPPVYKFPPKGVDGLANFLKDSEVVNAYNIRSEVTFYEDESGNIKWNQNAGVDEKFLIVKPDIVFFDITGEPILFIELVATHGINAEKLAKLKRIGIDTIQVSIPKDSPESIEKSFNTTERTKWIYNHVEERTQYIPISETNSKGISSIDEQQRILFDESFKCRQAQVNNLIRSITKCLESKQHRDIREGLELELSRVKNNTEEHLSRLDNIRAEHKNRVVKGFGCEVNEFDKEMERFEGEKGDFEEYYRDLEKRYKSKKSDLEREEKNIDREIYGEMENEGGDGNSIKERRRGVERLTVECRGIIDSEEEEIRRLEEEEIGLPEYFASQSEAITEKFGNLTKKELAEDSRIDKEDSRLPKQFESIEEEFRRAIESTTVDIPREFGSEDERIEKEFEGLREQACSIVMSRTTAGNTELHRRIRGLLEARKLFDDYQQAQILYRRYKKAYGAFKDGAHENWN